uniref:Tyrosine-protein phosphatase non-receptor type 20 n=1 Tax=Phallusia mammillata TaxID=59560 RepID=A0A6F9DQ22_9ASCI|nr:tyrosine-protein phosphatase non-receptor type 23-like [Phallusia mammillata]
MEGVPRLPMLQIEMKDNHGNIDWMDTTPESAREELQEQIADQLRKHISEQYSDDPHKYDDCINKFLELQTSAYKVIGNPDSEGCNTLKKYYGQLHYMQSRFQFTGENALKCSFIWSDSFTGVYNQHNTFVFEQVAIIFNIGACYSHLGAMESRTSEEATKNACVHFKFAARFFQYLADHLDTTLSAETSQFMMKLFINTMLGQGQECLWEKSILDNRKDYVVAKISQQVVDYYKLASTSLSNSEATNCMGSSASKAWNKLLTFKIAYYSAITRFYLGCSSWDQEKYGEGESYLASALDFYQEAGKICKTLKSEIKGQVDDALKYTADVIVGKYNSVKKDNEFVYHDRVPDKATLAEIKGASLVKLVPLDPSDSSVAGPDIFAKLVPMEAHLAASSYSEEKAKLLRSVLSEVDDKDEILEQFKSAIELDPDKLIQVEEEDKLDPTLIEHCASLSVNQTPIKELTNAMKELSDRFMDIDSLIHDTFDIIEEEESQSEKVKDICGKTIESPDEIEGIKNELEVCRDVHSKAGQMNDQLHTVSSIHISNLKTVSDGLDAIKKHCDCKKMTALLNDTDYEDISLVKKLCNKVKEMENQRQSLVAQLRTQLEEDDVTSALVTNHGVEAEDLFKEELKKHDSTIEYIKLNLEAQRKILDGVTEVNVRYSRIRKLVDAHKEHVKTKMDQLLVSCDGYKKSVKRCQDGTDFFKDLLDKVKEANEKMTALHEKNSKLRKKLMEKLEAKKPPPRPSAPKPKQTTPAVPKIAAVPGLGLTASELSELADGMDDDFNDPAFLRFLQMSGGLPAGGLPTSLPAVSSLQPSATLPSMTLGNVSHNPMPPMSKVQQRMNQPPVTGPGPPKNQPHQFANHPAPTDPSLHQRNYQPPTGPGSFPNQQQHLGNNPPPTNLPISQPINYQPSTGSGPVLSQQHQFANHPPPANAPISQPNNYQPPSQGPMSPVEQASANLSHGAHTGLHTTNQPYSHHQTSASFQQVSSHHVPTSTIQHGSQVVGGQGVHQQQMPQQLPPRPHLPQQQQQQQQLPPPSHHQQIHQQQQQQQQQFRQQPHQQPISTHNPYLNQNTRPAYPNSPMSPPIHPGGVAPQTGAITQPLQSYVEHPQPSVFTGQHQHHPGMPQASGQLSGPPNPAFTQMTTSHGANQALNPRMQNVGVGQVHVQGIAPTAHQTQPTSVSYPSNQQSTNQHVYPAVSSPLPQTINNPSVMPRQQFQNQFPQTRQPARYPTPPSQQPHNSGAQRPSVPSHQPVSSTGVYGTQSAGQRPQGMIATNPAGHQTVPMAGQIMNRPPPNMVPGSAPPRIVSPGYGPGQGHVRAPAQNQVRPQQPNYGPLQNQQPVRPLNAPQQHIQPAVRPAQPAHGIVQQQQIRPVQQPVQPPQPQQQQQQRFQQAYTQQPTGQHQLVRPAQNVVPNPQQPVQTTHSSISSPYQGQPPAAVYATNSQTIQTPQNVVPKSQNYGSPPPRHQSPQTTSKPLEPTHNSAPNMVQTSQTQVLQPSATKPPPSTPFNKPLTPQVIGAAKANHLPEPMKPSADLAGLTYTPPSVLQPSISSTSADEILNASPETPIGGLPAQSNPMLVPVIVDDLEEAMIVRRFDDIPYKSEADLMQFKTDTEVYQKRVSSLLTKQPGTLCQLDKDWKQLSDLQEKHARQLSTAIGRCSSYKNRFQDILPFDQSRIVLKETKDDYINASLVDGISPFCPRFIATQSPLPSSSSDFWTMVHEHQVTLIVMLVSKNDVPKKCAKYWPDDRNVPQKHGPLCVTFTTSRVHGSYIERTFTLKHVKHSLPRSLTQLQYTAWPEHGLPASTPDLLSFMRTVSNFHVQQRNLQWPIVVHCEDGVSHTGTFCAAYLCVQELDAGQGIPQVLDVVNKMRQRRKFMLQEKAQLKFVYDLVYFHAVDLLRQRGVEIEKKSSQPTTPAQASPCHKIDGKTFDVFGSGALSTIRASVEKMTVRPSDKTAPPTTNPSDPSAPHFNVPNSAPLPLEPGTAPNAPADIATLIGNNMSDLVQGTIVPPNPAPAQSPSNDVTSPASVQPDIVSSCNDEGRLCDVTGRGEAPGQQPQLIGNSIDLGQQQASGLDGKPGDSLLQQLTPESFTLGASDVKERQKITKADFFRPKDAGSGLGAQVKANDPFADLDPLWGLKK